MIDSASAHTTGTRVEESVTDHEINPIATWDPSTPAV